MTHIISISNQKGGVGKTTTAVNISAELALMGRKVLVIDFDPQGNATSGLGVQAAEEGKDLYDMFFGRVALSDIIKDGPVKGLSVAPSSSDLVGVEIELGKKPGRELILKTEINLLRASYDYIVIDCPPSSGLLSLNALGAADKILVPLQAEYYALEGISSLMKTIDFVKQTFNPQLSIVGIFMTMYDARTNLASQVEAEAKGYFGDAFIPVRIPRSIKISEAPSHGLPIGLYDAGSPGAKAYRALAYEVDARCYGTDTMVANG